MALGRTPLSPHLGLEVTGLDASRPISETDRQFIRDAWIEAGVLVFRGVGISDDAHINVSRVFGELEPAATANLNVEGRPELMRLAYEPGGVNKAYSTRYFLGETELAGWIGWHWDQSFMPKIVRGAVLRMVEPSTEMGETGLIDAVAAYERLSDEMKRRIEGLDVVYQYNGHLERRTYGRPPNLSIVRDTSKKSSTDYEFPATVHPLVITQQETGRKVLKLSPIHAREILGMDPAESDALLTALTDHLTDPEFAYFHRWGRDDLLVWDNWRILHSAVGVPPYCTRIAHRTTISGDYEFGRYLDPELNRDHAEKQIVD